MSNAETDTDSSRQRQRLTLIWAMTLGMLVLQLAGEALKSHLVVYIRATDLIDLILIAPLLITCLALLHEHFGDAQLPRWLRRAFVISAMVYLYGHALHMGTNAINAFALEVRDYADQLPDDLEALIYFLDEKLSHWLLFLARYAILACLLIAESKYLRAPLSPRMLVLAVIGGALYGAADGVVFIEGQTVYLIPVVLMGMGALWLSMWRSSGLAFAEFWRGGPLLAFISAQLPGMVFGFVLYVAVVGGVTQFSSLGVLGG